VLALGQLLDGINGQGEQRARAIRAVDEFAARQLFAYAALVPPLRHTTRQATVLHVTPPFREL
jgi:hypothetical protein